MDVKMEQRVKKYWTQRSHDFGTVRKNELENEMGQRWLREIERFLPEGKRLNILDVGTGTGFFAVLLAQQGHRAEGIDLTPAMLEEARILAKQRNLEITFREMDAQNLDYPNDSFDVVISRNLTWTLPDPERAYAEWFRVLKPGGVLLNFDAAYAAHVRSHSSQNRKVAPDSPYGHVGMTDALQQENDDITLSMDIGQSRPEWDRQVLKRIGFAGCQTDTQVGQRLLGELDLTTAPMFGIFARK
ncbi:MAG: class I SAM-dependent methyltransferase [Clostridia bacterium]|nr:class I SAM-dependent methyltransferase [Clostridia bacterium]